MAVYSSIGGLLGATTLDARRDFILESEALKQLREYVLVGIKLPDSTYAFEIQCPRTELTPSGLGEHYDVCGSARRKCGRLPN